MVGGWFIQEINNIEGSRLELRFDFYYYYYYYYYYYLSSAKKEKEKKETVGNTYSDGREASMVASGAEGCAGRYTRKRAVDTPARTKILIYSSI